MHKPEINLFHHPTTTVFVDDSEEFLYSIALGVDRLPYRSFSNPSQGLAYVNQFAGAYDLEKVDLEKTDLERMDLGSMDRGKKQLGRTERAGMAQAGKSLTAANLPGGTGGSLAKVFANVERKLGDPNRFAEPSVLVVDYSMPGSNGLDLCSQITNPNIKKVLLTGVADEKIAIDALNTELIDFYISKSESSLSHRLRNIISHLETRYFQDLFGWSKDSAVRRALPHLFEPAFADFFEDTLENLQVVEHYPLCSPNGFFLINTYGITSYLVLYSAEELGALIAQAELGHLSPGGLKQLETRQRIPCILPHLPASLVLDDKHLYSAQRIKGRQTWYCALIEGSRLGLRPPSSHTTYHQFLKTPPSYFQQEETTDRQ